MGPARRALGAGLALAGVLAGAGSAQAQGDAPPEIGITEALQAIRLAGPDGRERAVERAIALRPGPIEVAAVLQAGVHPEHRPEPGWSVQKATDTLGVTRPYHLYIPSTVGKDPTPRPLLVHMHGGVSRPTYVDDRSFAQWRGLWVEQADRLGIVLALPLGRSDCTWWSDAGVRHVRAVVRDAKRHVPIDDDACSATGFSDGGSGAYYFALAAPDPWASLLPLNGHPAVASGASRRQLYPQNSSTVPLFIAHTVDDSLYPANTVMPHWQAFLEQGAQLHTVLWPTGDHSPAYFPTHGAALAEFVAEVRRDSAPALVEWHTAHAETGASRWIAITEIGACPGDAPAPADVNVQSRPGRIRLGINVNEATEGDGVEITDVGPDSNASRIGLKVGDKIHGIDDRDVGSRRHLVNALATKKHGETIRVRVTRPTEDDLIELTGTLGEFVPQPTYPRQIPGAWIKAFAAGDELIVQSHNLRRFRVEVRPDLLDLEAPITVKVNGVVRFQGRVVPDVPGMIRSYAERADGGRLVLAVLEIDCTKTVGSTPAPGDRTDEDF